MDGADDTAGGNPTPPLSGDATALHPGEAAGAGLPGADMSFPPGGDVADDRERQLDPRVVTLGRVVGGIASAGFSTLLFIGALLVMTLSSLPPVGKILLLPAWLVTTCVLAWLGLHWPVLEYRRTWYRVNARGMEIRRGVIWREIVTVPRSRVQHTDVSQGPLERAFELATLVIHTAGTEHASVSLSGLEATRAVAIRDFLIEGTGQDAV